MKKKYLLYIDILGFSDLVKKKPEEVRRLYKIIEELNCHRHDQFKVIVFSDTILIYNLEDAVWERDCSYVVMFLIEFAQNLFYSLAGKKIFFRSVLVFGEFEHAHPRNIERFFGNALVKAYQDEKQISCFGLFIDKKCQEYNKIFDTLPYNKEYRFVYINQVLKQLEEGYYGPLPVSGSMLSMTDSEWHIAKDIQYFRDVNQTLLKHKDPRVKEKCERTLKFYKKKFPRILKQLENNKFSFESISNDLDWRPAINGMKDGYRGQMVPPPTVEGLIDIFEAARKAGKEAARNECLKRFGAENPTHSQLILPCGGAFIILDVKGQNKLGRFLLENCNSLNRVSCDTDYKKRGLSVSIYDMHDRQEKVISEAAAEAALKVLKSRLHIEGWIESYFS